MLSIGYDIGSSSIKAAVLDTGSGRCVAAGAEPRGEMRIDAPRPGWAEQDPETWWRHVRLLTRRLLRGTGLSGRDVGAIGISYQMHGLVIVDRALKAVRPAIIWCDSRAVEIGNAAVARIGPAHCRERLLNSPGNFTASKLRWVRENEPRLYRRAAKWLLPGDFIALRMTGEAVTTVPGLSEGIFWDFKERAVSRRLLAAYDIDEALMPEVRPTFGEQGRLSAAAASELGLRAGAVVSYRAGDQPNNAFSLGVLEPGQVAATAGTSGVVYGVTDRPRPDPESRVNTFVHVNYGDGRDRLGVLLCINGTGILNSWLRRTFGAGVTYEKMNALAGSVGVSADGLTVLPFGNGAERVLGNRTVGAAIHGLDLNRHGRAHLCRAAQEGIAFAFRYGMDVMRSLGLVIDVIHAGRANMFLSPVFARTLATVAGASIELFDTDGALGAARGAACGAGAYGSFDEAFASLARVGRVRPDVQAAGATAEAYDRWLLRLEREGIRRGGRR